MTHLGLFAKHPIAGRVKTRLGKSLTPERAATLYEAFVHDVIARFHETGDERTIVYAPNSNVARDWFTAVGRDRYHYRPQPDADLGGRIADFFDSAFQAGSRRVVLIGSDSPTLPVSLVEQAFAELEHRDVVIGPATDGGYYLIGQRATSRPLFAGIDWSTSLVLQQTIDRVVACGAGLSVLPPWYDVDTIETLHAMTGHLAALAAAGLPDDSTETRRVLGTMAD